MPNRRSVLGQFGQPAPFEPALQFGGPRVAGEQRAGAGLGGADGQHLPGVRIRGPLLDQQIVTVVPQRHQPKIINRRVRRRAIADHHPHVTAPRRKERAVARGPPGLATSTRTLSDRVGQARHPQPLEIALVRHHDHRAPATLGAGPGRARQAGRPVAARSRTRGHLPQRAGRTAGADRVQKPLPGGIFGQGSGKLILRKRVIRGRTLSLLGGRMTRGHRQPEYVGEGSGVVISDLSDQGRDLIGQDGFGRDDLVQRSEAPS